MKRLEIPESFLINGVKGMVYLEAEVPRVLKDKLKPGDMGVCCYSYRSIILASWLSEDELEETFIHEVLHAMLEEDDMLGPGLEHHVIETLEAPLTRLLRQLVYKEITH